MADEEEAPRMRFNSATKLARVGESASTSLSSSSSSGSLHHPSSTDTKYPTELLRHKKHRGNNRDRLRWKQCLTVEEEGEEGQKGDNKTVQAKKLPHYRIPNDRREFLSGPQTFRMSRCKSVGTLRLARVQEQKKEDDDSKKLLVKLNKLFDKDQFNLGRSTSNSKLLSGNEQMLPPSIHSSAIMEIRQMEEPREETKNLPQKTAIGCQLQKIIVDEIDEKRKHREDRDEPIIESIMEERNDDEVVDQQLRSVLTKLHQQNDFIKKMNNSDEVKEDMLAVDTESITLLTETIKEENENENQL